MSELSEKIEKLADNLLKWKDEADKEIKTFGEAGKETKTAIEKIERELVDLKVKVERNDVPAPGQTRLVKTIGQMFVESEQYKTMIAHKVYNSEPMEVKDIVASRLIDTATGLPVTPMILPGVIEEPQIELRVAQLLAQATTTSNSIYYVRGTYTTAAVPKKESKQGSLQTKPESAFAFTPDAETVKTIPVWIPATRQILSDAPALRGLVDNNLRYDVLLEQENQILFGNAVDPNLNGICPQAQVYDTTLPTQLGVTNITRIDHLRAAVLQARQARYPISGIVLNPFDWAAIELTKNDQGNYIWVSVNDGGVARLWRVPIVESDNMPQGQFLAGAFRMGATLYTREGVSIRISEHHASFFIQNLVAILCELRCALVVTRPQAFVYGGFEPYGS